MKRLTAALLALALGAGGVAAEEGAPGPVVRPQPRAVAPAAAPVAVPAPTRGPVTNLPLPRYVTLKTGEGNARRGPGLAHRIDWVFTRPGMPLRITAEHEHWRRVEDAEGAGGWVHYALLSGTRAVLVAEDLADLHASPDDRSAVVARAEAGVIARLLECRPDWCRVSRDGNRGWMHKSALWGVDPGEVTD